MNTTLESYDALPYPGDPVAAMHPDRLAAMGRIYGLATVSPDRCRVIELGCSDGGNLIPLALAYPESTFLGIDLSRGQIASGQAEVTALGLQNLELRHASILDLSASEGPFDTLLCHGVYSWVSPEVQQRILLLCRELLAPAGIAYISYNTYPGWQAAGVIRQAMRLASRAETDWHRRVTRARSGLTFLEQSLADDPSPHARQVLALIDELRERPDFYLAHEYLEDCNEPLWFCTFLERLEGAGLHFVAEATQATMEPDLFAPAARQALAQFANDRAAREQAMDLLRNRRFRQSLIARQPASATPDPRTLPALWIASEARRIPGDEATFALADGTSVTTADAALIESLTRLESAWPSALLGSQLPAAPESLLAIWMRGLIEVHVVAPRCGPVSARPRTCPWLRRQAARGACVTDLRHRLLDLDRTERLLIPLLDGSRDVAAIREWLVEQVQSGRVILGDAAPPEPDELRTTLGEIVTTVLRNLARQSLIEDCRLEIEDRESNTRLSSIYNLQSSIFNEYEPPVLRLGTGEASR